MSHKFEECENELSHYILTHVILNKRKKRINYMYLLYGHKSLVVCNSYLGWRTVVLIETSFHTSVLH